MRKRRSVVFVITMVGVLGLILAISVPSTCAQGPQEIKLGVIASLSGPAAPWGLPWQRGVLMAAEDINKEGGVQVKGKKYLINVISDDDKYQPATTTNIAQRLITQHGVKFILGPIQSPLVLAMHALTEPAKVITMHDAATPKRIASDKPFAFCMHIPAPDRALAGYGWLSKTYPAIKKHAGITQSGESGRVYLDIVKTIPNYGWENVGVELYEIGTKDFYPLLNKVLAKKPDFLDIFFCPPGDMALLVKQGRQLGFKGIIAGIAPVDLNAMEKVAGSEALEGFVATGMIIPGDFVLPAEEKFYTRYMKTYGSPFNETAMDSYNSVIVLKMVMEQTGTVTDTEVLAKAIEKVDFQSLRGHFFMGGEKTFGIKHQAVYEFILVQFKNGKGVNIGRVQGVIP